MDFEQGHLSVNGVSLRCYDPVEYHRHLTAVFQGFSKYNSTVNENVGVGYVEKLDNKAAVEAAVHLAEADSIITSLPHGLSTKLQESGFSPSIHTLGGNVDHSQFTHHLHGLSGGEVSTSLSIILNIALNKWNTQVAKNCDRSFLHEG